MDKTRKMPDIPYRDMDYFFRKKHFFGKQKVSDHNVTAVFPDRAALDGAIQELAENGFRHDEIHTAVVHENSVLEPPLRIVSLAPFFVPIGLLIGSFIGAAVGVAAHFGYLAFFGIEPFYGSAWQSLQANSVAGGFVVGILALVFGLRLPEYQPWKFETNLPEGTHVLMVRTTREPDAARAWDILTRRVRGTEFPAVGEALAA